MTSYSNLPRRFVARHTTFVSRRAPNLPQYVQKIFRYKKRAYYDEWRPWQDEFRRLNQEGVKTRMVFVEPIRDWTFLRGDRVEVLKGPERGKQGIINHIIKERNWVFVQGLNLRREYSNRQGTALGNIISKEDPFLINHEVKLVDPTDLMPTDADWRYDDEGNKVRVSLRTGHVIPVPQQSKQTIDYVDKSSYKEGSKDTPAKRVNEVTFQPRPATFEMEICEKMKIKEDRIPYPMYWY